jgi:hypothetical protein
MFRGTIMKRVLGIILLAMASACASGRPSAEELATADYGSPISQEEAQTMAERWLEDNLKDPFSAQIRWAPVEKGLVRDAPIRGGSIHFGYLLDAEINAKNSYGAYVGFRPYRFFFINGRIFSVY